jgi:transcriptional regulator with XRE-family HTH domain
MIGDRIKNFRLAKGLSLRQLETKSSVSNVLISRYETGKAVPPPKALGRIAEALGVSIAQLNSENNESAFFNEEKFKTKLSKLHKLSTADKKIIEGVLDSFLKGWEIQNLANKD